MNQLFFPTHVIGYLQLFELHLLLPRNTHELRCFANHPSFLFAVRKYKKTYKLYQRGRGGNHSLRPCASQITALHSRAINITTKNAHPALTPARTPNHRLVFLRLLLSIRDACSLVPSGRTRRPYRPPAKKGTMHKSVSNTNWGLDPRLSRLARRRRSPGTEH